MEAPILRLYRDVWAQIALYLDSRSTNNLCIVGNIQLASSVSRETRSYRYLHPGLFLDVGALLNTCNRFPSLEELVLTTPQFLSLPKEPFAPLHLPSTLTTLDLRFYGCLTLVKATKLASSTPSLLSLTLDNKRDTKLHRLADFELPSNLKSLSLLKPEAVCLSPQGIANLPRGLTNLSLSWCTKKEDEPVRATAINKYHWPLTLTSCTLASADNILLENLPRTVTTLDMSEQEFFSTEFQTEEYEFAFPWRVFFPRLKNLLLALLPMALSAQPILKSILIAETLNSNDVEKFISSGFWHMPTVFEDKSGVITYPPSYDVLSLPFNVYTDQTNEDWEEIAPLLSKTDVRRLFINSYILSLIPCPTEVSWFEDSRSGAKPIPFGVRKITAYFSQIPVEYLPASVTSLECGNLYLRNADGPLRSSEVALPTSLTELRSPGLLRADIALLLPASLTEVTLLIDSAATWKTIAVGLVSLRSMSIELQHPWNCFDCLEPIRSSTLESVSIALLVVQYNSSRYRQFFSPTVFPSSLRSLELRGSNSDPSVLAILPQQLLELTIWGFHWDPPEDTLPCHEADGKSIADLIRCLPPKLRKLELKIPTGFNMSVLASWNSLKDLPRSLLYFKHQGHFDEPKPQEMEEAIQSLPPYLLHAIWPTQVEAFRSSYLNKI